jgi:hypothetical protein
MTKLFGLFSLLFVLPFTTAPEAETPVTEGAHIQVALLLDTSNSMDGLIEQAKSQLWKMVNQLATTKKNGEIPNIEIALYEYGNDRLAVTDGYVRLVSPLTTDLDLISEKLFQLTTNGGSEYCGYVIDQSADELAWTEHADDLKLIIIAGNEPFTQGPKPYQEACKKAIEKGIMINTIFCGNYDEGIRTEWKAGADCADGKYFNIDQDETVQHIPTPYDQRMIELNDSLNGTYIGYGSLGAERMEMQMVQDDNAGAFGSTNAAERAAFKAKKAYKNTSWDLVDAVEEEAIDLEEIPADELPDEMKNMKPEEREAYVLQKKKEREVIQAEILELEKKANAFRAEKRKEMSEGDNTLDQVIQKAVKEQATKKGFKEQQ